jgi:dTDP-4-dehydrorhamnose 3,5-epimerase
VKNQVRDERKTILRAGTLLHGVQLFPLVPHEDRRGSFTEIFQSDWGLGVSPVQWSSIHSKPGVLRGMYLHLRHDECIIVIRGRASVGLYDLRPDSPTREQSALIELCEEEPAVLSFGRGIVHGWYFHESSLHLQGVSESYEEYNDDDNLGCHWEDPHLGIPWPQRSSILSDRSAKLPSLATLRAQIESGRFSSGSSQARESSQSEGGAAKT